MSGLSALDDLCGWATDCLDSYLHRDAMRIADRIETELSERYMELPLDADGVPIRPDDLMACTAFDTNDFDGKEHVLAVGNGFWVDKDGCTHIPSETRHAKPRTIEDVLRDCCNEWNKHCGHDWESGVYAKYATEIREIIGGEK